MVVPTSCINESAFCYTLPNFASKGRSGTLRLDRGNMFPPHVWKSTEATVADATQDDVGDEVDICALCYQKHTTTECGECNLNYCAECIDPHTCGAMTVY